VTAAVDGELAGMLPRVAAAVTALQPRPARPGWCDLGVVELLDAYRCAEVEPGEVVDACLARIAESDPSIGAVWAVDEPGALAAAERSTARWRAGVPRPLEGVPIVVKDLLDTAGLRTTGGSRVFADRVPNSDAAAVAAVRAAGAIVLAKTATYELGCGDEQTPFGVAHNPWHLEHTTGGSSAGSAAALAARYAPLAIGTDTGGSIRIPASYCGVTGLKPTLGRVPASGILGLAPSLDAIGPMARTAADAALLLRVLASDERPAGPASVHGLRIGVARAFFTDLLDDAVAAAFEDALGVLLSLGVELVPVEIVDAPHGANLSWLITMYEAAVTYHGVPRDEMTATFRGRLDVGDRVGRSTYLDALRARRGLIRSVCNDIRDLDAIVLPACVSPAPRLDDMDAPVAGVPVNWPDVSARTMALWNVTGLPSVAVPTGRSPSGLPVGMQIAGLPHSDERLLAIAAAFQAATAHHLSTPLHP
jgi:aspartyl-tRNA(Asn)/glutamyl-tRNA(Gln) amidotransferase subunit A